jgi:hypothetical protein
MSLRDGDDDYDDGSFVHKFTTINDDSEKTERFICESSSISDDNDNDDKATTMTTTRTQRLGRLQQRN